MAILTEEQLAEIAVGRREHEVIYYANALVSAAYANPTQSISNTDAGIYKSGLNLRRNSRVDKIAGEVTLTQEEKDIAKTDQKLAEYEIRCYDAKEKAMKELRKGATVAEVDAMVIADLTTWPVWSPPV